MPREPFEDLPELIRGCRNGEDASWERFLIWFRCTAARVLSRFRNLSEVERGEAEDRARAKVSEEIISGGVRGATNWEIRGFVQTVVTNSARDVWRQRRPTEPLPPLLRDQDGPWPDRQAEFRAKLECLKKLIRAWPPQDQFIFMMKLEQVPAATIRVDLERLYGVFVTTGAVDVRFSRLRANVRDHCLGTMTDD